MADHEHGSMDIEVQEKTFAGFVTYVTRGIIVCIVALILIAMING